MNTTVHITATNAVYIGAGTDIMPITLFPNIKTFIYIDSQPQSPYGTLDYESGYFYSDNFLSRLHEQLKELNFVINRQDKNYLEFTKMDRTLKYYINTSFPEHLTEIMRKDIAECDTLILSGFCPDKAIIECMPKLETVYGTINTVYVQDHEDDYAKERAVFNYLIENPKKVENYILYDELVEPVTFIKCDNGLTEFDKKQTQKA